MTHYEFKPGGKKGRNIYQGSWKEAVSVKIDLPFTVQSMETVLTCGGNPSQSPYTHQDIAHWCDRFHLAMLNTEPGSLMDIAAEIALEINAQWEMFLANSYEYKELEKLDLSTIRLPVTWFADWLKQLKDA